MSDASPQKKNADVFDLPLGNQLKDSEVTISYTPKKGYTITARDLSSGPYQTLPDHTNPVFRKICEDLQVNEDERSAVAKCIFKAQINIRTPQIEDMHSSVLQTVEVDNISITPLTSVYKPVHPSIGIVDDVAYVGVWFPCQVTFPPRKKGQEPVTKIRDTLFLITDKRETMLANDEILRTRGWQLAYRPLKLKGVWPTKKVKAYLDGYKSDPKQIYDQALNDWKTYIEFQDEREYLLHALWDIATPFSILFRTFPYLYIGGIKRSGKSKALTLHSCLAFNAFFSNNMSTSSIYRLIQNGHGTLLIDESEKLSNPERALEFRSILLSGYKRGSVVYRIEKTKKEVFVPEAFEIYSPKALANIGGIEDVLEDRVIFTIMKRGKRRQITDREIDLESEHWSELRSELNVFFLEHWREIKFLYDQISECDEHSELVNFLGATEKNIDTSLLTARELELWKPIFVMAKYFDDVLSMFTSSSK